MIKRTKSRELILVAVCFLLATSLAFGQTNSDKPEAQQKISYLVVYRPGPGWVPGKPLKEQPLGEHGKYLLSLYAEGTLKFGGPLLDDAGGALVIEAADENHAKAVIAADPAIRSGIFLPEMHPWNLIDWAHVKTLGP